jgi:glycosyltransferase involved in cell wall biosynthesis
MNILVLFTYGISLKTWKKQGLIQRELELYKKLLTLNPNLKFTFITFGDNEDLEIQKQYDLECFEIIPIYSEIKLSRNKISNLIRTILFIFKYKKNLEKIHLVKTNQLNGVWIGVILKKVLSTPLYVRTGFSPYLFAKYQNQRYYKILIFKILTLLGIRYGDLYTVSSKQEKKLLINELRLNKVNIEIRSNWIIETDYQSLEGRKKDSLLAVGRLENQKNYFQLIENLKDSDYSLDIVGTGSLKKEIASFAKKNNVSVNFLGKLDNAKLLDLYRNYTFYVLASHYEGNSKSIKEAMNGGCVVIANNIMSVSEIITDYKSGIIVDFNKANIPGTLSKLLLNNELLNEISFNAHKAVKEFSLTSYATKELEDYFLLTEAN